MNIALIFVAFLVGFFCWLVLFDTKDNISPGAKFPFFIIGAIILCVILYFLRGIFSSIGLLLFIVGTFIFYLIIDFMIFGGDINKFLDKWVEKTLWAWLPFYALWRLTRDIILKETKK